MLRLIEDAEEDRKHDLSWKLINNITGMKSAMTGALKGKNKEDRLLK